MGKAQRTKGAVFEREIANDLGAFFKLPVKRNIGQARDGGDDITLQPFRIECKRRAGIAVYPWMEQCVAACKPGDIPVVVARADQKDAVVLLRYADFKQMAKAMIGSTDADIFR
jgi:hypothetical protein